MPANRFDWERVIRRCRLSASCKQVALTVATYANADGTSAFPGNERLRLVTGLSDKSVRTNLGTLRSIGLLNRVYEGSRAMGGTRGRADEYELEIPHDLHRRIHLLGPDESWETEECDDSCGHADSPVMSTGERMLAKTGHRYSVPRPPVMSSRPPVMSSADTGNGYRPPDHYQPSTRSSHQGGQQPENPLTTQRRLSVVEGWKTLTGEDENEDGVKWQYCERHPLKRLPCLPCHEQQQQQQRWGA